MRASDLKFNPHDWVGKVVLIHNEGGAGRVLSIILCDASLPIEKHQLLRLINVDIKGWLGDDNVVSGILLSGGVKDGVFHFSVGDVSLIAAFDCDSEVEFCSFMNSWK